MFVWAEGQYALQLHASIFWFCGAWSTNLDDVAIDFGLDGIRH